MHLNQKFSLLFWLWNSKKDSDGRCPIYVRITIDKQRAQFSLGLKVRPDQFNSSTGKVKGNNPEAVRINSEINIIKGKLQQQFNLLIAQQSYVTSDLLKNAYLGKYNSCKTLLQLISYHNENFEEKVGTGKRCVATLKKYNATKEKARAFVGYQFGTTDIPLSQIKPSFAEDMYHYLSVYEHLENNTIIKHIKNIKKMLSLAVSKEWMGSNPITGYKCSYKASERERLTHDELKLLINAKFERRALEEAKDCYLAMCFTGYAYKDALLLTPDHIQVLEDGGKWFVKNREKTECRENVPILPVVESIIAKYKKHPFCVAYHKVFPIHSNQKFNNCLKEIAILCGIRKTLTTHTARHTFATTVTLSNGMPIETVSALLGHSSIRTTQIYAKVVAKKVSEDMNLLKQKLGNVLS